VLERTAGDFTAARKHLEEAAKLDPNRYSTHYNLGYTLEQLQDNAGAKEQLQKAIELDSTEPESYFELAKFCASWAKPMQRSNSWFSTRNN